MKKYELTDETTELYGRTLYRIKAITDFSNVKVGQLGGFVETEYNLSHHGDCWLYDNSKVLDSARVYNDAKLFYYSEVYDDAEVYDNARVYLHSAIFGNAEVFGDAQICGNSKIYGNAKVFENAVTNNDARVFEDAIVHSYAKVFENAKVSGTSNIGGNAVITEVCTKTPIVLTGYLNQDIIITDNHIKIGYVTKSFDMLSDFEEFYDKHKVFLKKLIKKHVG